MTSLTHSVVDKVALSRPCLHRRLPQRRCCSVQSQTSTATPASSAEAESCRRQVLFAGAAAALFTLTPSNAEADDLVEFRPDSKQTPSIRAGVINYKDAYRFSHPKSWREQKIANIQSGNFCMPRCDEPWTEVVFADDQQGKAQLLVAPLRKLTNKANASIDQIAPNPSSLVGSIGPYVTGTYMDEEDVISANKRSVDGRTYYVYEANSLGATNGPHTVTAVTTKGDLAYLFILSANDKQWAKSKNTLKQLVETFHV